MRDRIGVQSFGPAISVWVTVAPSSQDRKVRMVHVVERRGGGGGAATGVASGRVAMEAVYPGCHMVLPGGIWNAG